MLPSHEPVAATWLSGGGLSGRDCCLAPRTGRGGGALDGGDAGWRRTTTYQLSSGNAIYLVLVRVLLARQDRSGAVLGCWSVWMRLPTPRGGPRA